MNQTEPDFWVLEYVTITKDPRTGLVVAIGGTEQAADILQRTGGFLTSPGPRGDYHRLPHGLPIEQQRLKRPPPRTPCSPPATASTSTPP
ncbi:hypothetical protein [Streptomyces alfalfae]|uniref:hypothetical protein n=1 Tax=Streptomyces alfalfae TaxID=1642299 RepID=UPI001F0AFB5E|nr:hypothetical protein [Streptomyces alfalfae]